MEILSRCPHSFAGCEILFRSSLKQVLMLTRLPKSSYIFLKQAQQITMTQNTIIHKKKNGSRPRSVCSCSPNTQARQNCSPISIPNTVGDISFSRNASKFLLVLNALLNYALALPEYTTDWVGGTSC